MAEELRTILDPKLTASEADKMYPIQALRKTVRTFAAMNGIRMKAIYLQVIIETYALLFE